MEELVKLGEAEGVNSGDIAKLFRHGMSVELFEKAKKCGGWTLKDHVDMLHQFGPQHVALLQALMMRGHGKEQDNTPEPAPTPAPHPDHPPAHAAPARNQTKQEAKVPPQAK